MKLSSKNKPDRMNLLPFRSHSDEVVKMGIIRREYEKRLESAKSIENPDEREKAIKKARLYYLQNIYGTTR